MSRQPTFASLFSGCGGFDLGFQKTGFTCRGASDIDPLVLDVHRQNLGTNTFVADLSTEFPEFLRNGAEVDVLLSGSPCQGFSTLGKRALHDPRNSLLLSGGKIALKVRPKVFIAENVPGVIQGEHKKYWVALHELLRNAGYQTLDLRIDSAQFGVPQRRTRIFLVAWTKKVLCEAILPPRLEVGLGHALSSLEGLPNHQPHYLVKGSSEYLISKKIKQGQKLSNVRAGDRSVHTWDIPQVFGAVTKSEKEVLAGMLRIRRQLRQRETGDADPIPMARLCRLFDRSVVWGLVRKNYLCKKGNGYDLANTFNGKFRRLEINQPAYTVDTRFGYPRYFLHPLEHRGFTVREAARLQGFPDDFIFSGTEQRAIPNGWECCTPARSNGACDICSYRVARLTKCLLET